MQVSVGKSRIRVFFSPEKKPRRQGIDAVVQSVKRARSSVVFCLFSPTDKALRDALFEAGDDGKMMFGLINAIPKVEPKKGKKDAGAVARVEIYHRSKDQKDVYAHALYARAAKPFGFWWESTNLPGGAQQQFPVYIHHKFVIIDAETDNPTIYTGSANMSNASSYNNDENLLEIKNNPELAQMYLCEFMRLYEHYRARAAYERWRAKRGKDRAYRLAGDSRWAEKAFTEGTPEFKCRINMVHGV